MPARQQQCQQVIDAQKARGVAAQMLALLDLSVRGNSHNMMVERNSAELTQLMIQWLGRADLAN